MSEDWLFRWTHGRTGWHEPDGNDGLKSFWPDFDNPGRVLVPLCGKSPDLLWLAKRGHEVVGVELSDIAVEGFFKDQNLDFECDTHGPLTCYTATDCSVTVYCGDYFDFQSSPFDALYDRAALVALTEELRPRYVMHTDRLLKPGATRLVITLEYDQNVVNGPPFSVMPDELARYWGNLERIAEKDDIDNCPPKFRKAGLTEISEVFWLAR